MTWIGDTVVGSVGLLSHYPVKSTGGQALTSAVLGDRGLRHDREWAVDTSDGGIASGKTTRRFRKVEGLHQVAARTPTRRLIQPVDAARTCRRGGRAGWSRCSSTGASGGTRGAR